jgi:DNA repair protein RadA/Sms
VDLAICLAIASAFLNKTLSADIAAVGEVGLLGEVRKVQGLDRRVKEAKKLGYRVASAESGRSVAAAIKKLLTD